MPRYVPLDGYDAVDVYVYEGTNVLANKFGIRDAAALSRRERQLTAVREGQLLASPVRGFFDFAHLCAIHAFLFQDVYEWAGEPRIIAIAKGNTMFCLPQNIEPYAQDIFSWLGRCDLLRGRDREGFCEGMAKLAGDINALHPFREGNGRTQRLFIGQVASEAGWHLNLSDAPEERVLDAFVAAMEDYEPLTSLLLDTVSPK